MHASSRMSRTAWRRSFLSVSSCSNVGEQELRREHVTTQPPAFGLRGQSDPCDPMRVEIRFPCSRWTVVFVVLRVALHGKRQTLLRVRSDVLGRVGIPEVNDGKLALPGAAADVEGDPSMSFHVPLDRAMCGVVVVERVRGEPDRDIQAPNHVKPRGLDSIVLKDCPQVLPVPPCSSKPTPQFSQGILVRGPTFFWVNADALFVSKERWEGLWIVFAGSPKKNAMVIPAAEGSERR